MSMSVCMWSRFVCGGMWWVGEYLYASMSVCMWSRFVCGGMWWVCRLVFVCVHFCVYVESVCVWCCLGLCGVARGCMVC